MLPKLARKHATHTSMPPMPPSLTRYPRKHATHATHPSTNSTPFLKLSEGQQILLDPDSNGAGSLHVSGCNPQLEFDAATSTATNG